MYAFITFKDEKSAMFLKKMGTLKVQVPIFIPGQTIQGQDTIQNVTLYIKGYTKKEITNNLPRNQKVKMKSFKIRPKEHFTDCIHSKQRCKNNPAKSRSSVSAQKILHNPQYTSQFMEKGESEMINQMNLNYPRRIPNLLSKDEQYSPSLNYRAHNPTLQHKLNNHKRRKPNTKKVANSTGNSPNVQGHHYYNQYKHQREDNIRNDPEIKLVKLKLPKIPLSRAFLEGNKVFRRMGTEFCLHQKKIAEENDLYLRNNPKIRNWHNEFQSYDSLSLLKEIQPFQPQKQKRRNSSKSNCEQ